MPPKDRAFYPGHVEPGLTFSSDPMRHLRIYRVIALGWMLMIGILWLTEAHSGTLTSAHTITHACSITAGLIVSAALWSRSLRWPRVHALILAVVTACLGVRLGLDALTGAGVPAASFVVLHIPAGLAMAFLSARTARLYAAGTYVTVGATALWSGPVDPALLMFTAASLIILSYVSTNGQQATTQRMSMLAYRDMAYRDVLTGTFNRRFAEQLMRRLIDRELNVTVALIDLDHFKTLNDTHGHAHGDRALRGVVTALQAVAPSGVTVARWGGEEFLVIFENVPPTKVRGVLEDMARRVRALTVAHPLTITFSGGVASVAEGGNLTALLGAADTRLYAAKAQGRDRVVYGEPSWQGEWPNPGTRRAPSPHSGSSAHTRDA